MDQAFNLIHQVTAHKKKTRQQKRCGSARAGMNDLTQEAQKTYQASIVSCLTYQKEGGKTNLTAD